VIVVDTLATAHSVMYSISTKYLLSQQCCLMIN